MCTSFRRGRKKSRTVIGDFVSGALVSEPGTAFLHSNASAHLVGAVLRNAVDHPLLNYAREKLFDPLGIDTRPDMLKIGRPYLDEGRWQGRRTVSSQWVRESTTNQLSKEQTTSEGPYGYLWRVGAIESHPYCQGNMPLTAGSVRPGCATVSGRRMTG
jgi:CubicO group peptidase (beta-lactamase class C family)